MYRMSVITMLAPESLTSKINVPHCTKMALVHDMAESLVGDITPVCGISKKDKSEREKQTIDFIADRLLGSSVAGIGLAGQGIKDIWQEYEDGETMNAKFVHDVDKIELLLQMVEYERSHKEENVDLAEFSYVAQKIELAELKEWAKEILREREELWKELGREFSSDWISVAKLESLSSGK